MRLFYAFWFFFCAGWGYVLAGFAESDAPSWGNLFASFPLALLTCVVLFWLELRRLPPGQFAQLPSLRLKPWNRPTGFILFIGLTFVFTSLWGVVIAAVAHLPGLRVALHFLLLGAGTVGAVLVCRHAFPAKFGV
jgi:hypothetical protein